MRRLLLAFFRKLASLVGVPEIQSRLDFLDLRLSTAATQLNSRQMAFERLIETRVADQILDHIRDSELLLTSLRPHLDEIQRALTQSMVSHTELVADGLRNYVRDLTSQALAQIDELTSQLARHRRFVNNIQVTSSVVNHSSKSDLTPDGTKAIITDAMYVALEDHFRGDPLTIRQRQSQYLSLVRQAPIEEGYLLDLGCGRGEWLSLLVSEGIQAEGLDSNAACVAECQGTGLTVHHGDLMAHLRGLADESLPAITMFQVLEHLPFPVLLDVFKEARRVLRKGGLFIGEVPNAENLTVAASTFWIDPTHQRPLTPSLLRFIAQESGFGRVDGVYSTPLKSYPNLLDTDDDFYRLIRDIYLSLYGDADFAVIAWA